MSKPEAFIVDDNEITRYTLGKLLEADFETRLLASGEACLAALAHSNPALVLLDVEMGGMDGFETCRQLRQAHDVPVLFVSGHDTLEERVTGLDCGGDDFLAKPVDPQILRRKARKLATDYAERRRLDVVTATLERKASDYQRAIADTGLLLRFMRKSLLTQDYTTLAQDLLETTRDYGIDCHVQIRYPGSALTLTHDGVASALEESVVARSVAMGRTFQFSRRLVINYDLVSILVLDLPTDAASAEKVRQNLGVLAESAEVIAETIAMRKESAERAETLQAGTMATSAAIADLRSLIRRHQADTRMCLGELIENVEKTFVYLGLTTGQENTVSDTLRHGAERILGLFDRGLEFDAHFQRILDAMNPPRPDGSDELWL